MGRLAGLHDDGIAVIYDVTGSLQVRGGGAESGGERRFAAPLARAAVAAGADGLFLEVHPDPPRALSDRAVQLTPGEAEALLRSAAALRRTLLGLSAAPAAAPSEVRSPLGETDSALRSPPGANITLRRVPAPPRSATPRPP